MPRNRRIVIDQQTSESMLLMFLLPRVWSMLGKGQGVVTFVAPHEFPVLMAITGRTGREGATKLAEQIMGLADDMGLSMIASNRELKFVPPSEDDDLNYVIVSVVQNPCSALW